jgi:hypothetical protein
MTAKYEPPPAFCVSCSKPTDLYALVRSTFEVERQFVCLKCLPDLRAPKLWRLVSIDLPDPKP